MILASGTFGRVGVITSACGTGCGLVAEAEWRWQAWSGGLQIGGGVTPENAAGYLEAGASHVIVTSYVFRDGRLDEVRPGLGGRIVALYYRSSTLYPDH
jgi:hypothetical protein